MNRNARSGPRSLRRGVVPLAQAHGPQDAEPELRSGSESAVGSRQDPTGASHRSTRSNGPAPHRARPQPRSVSSPRSDTGHSIPHAPPRCAGGSTDADAVPSKVDQTFPGKLANKRTRRNVLQVAAAVRPAPALANRNRQLRAPPVPLCRQRRPDLRELHSADATALNNPIHAAQRIATM